MKKTSVFASLFLVMVGGAFAQNSDRYAEITDPKVVSINKEPAGPVLFHIKMKIVHWQETRHQGQIICYLTENGSSIMSNNSMIVQ